MSASRSRALLIAVSIVGYALLAHYTNISSNAHGLGALLAISPPLVALLLLAAKAPKPALAVAMVIAASLITLWFVWPILARHYSVLYLLQQCGMYALLAASFGRSLMPGQQPLCSRWAQMVRGALPLELQRYTRTVTAAWTIFFVGIAALSIALFVFAPLSTWSVFANFLTTPLIALMFAGEFAWRSRHLSPAYRIGFAESVRAYLAASRARPL